MQALAKRCDGADEGAHTVRSALQTARVRGTIRFTGHLHRRRKQAAKSLVKKKQIFSMAHILVERAAAVTGDG